MSREPRLAPPEVYLCWSLNYEEVYRGKKGRGEGVDIFSKETDRKTLVDYACIEIYLSMIQPVLYINVNSWRGGERSARCLNVDFRKCLDGSNLHHVYDRCSVTKKCKKQEKKNWKKTNKGNLRKVYSRSGIEKITKMSRESSTCTK